MGVGKKFLKNVLYTPGNIGINPLNEARGELYLNSRSFLGLPNLTLFGDPAAPVWPNLFGHVPSRDATAVAPFQPVIHTSGPAVTSKGIPVLRYDGIDDNIGNGAQPNPRPSVALGYTWIFFGRFREVTAPPAPFSCGILSCDGLGAFQLGYETNPHGPPFVATAAGSFAVHTANINPFYGMYSLCFDPPSGTGIVRAYKHTKSGGQVQLALTPVWAYNPAATSAYQIGGNIVLNCCPNWDAVAVIWYSETKSAQTLKGIYKYLALTLGDE